MRALSYVIATVFGLTGSTLAGSADRLPGVGTFVYCGSPIGTARPEIRAAIGH